VLIFLARRWLTLLPTRSNTFSCSTRNSLACRAGAISLMGVGVPLLMGGSLGAALPRDGVLFSPAIQPYQAALFLGAAMAITAFPVLARIIHEE